MPTLDFYPGSITPPDNTVDGFILISNAALTWTQIRNWSQAGAAAVYTGTGSHYSRIAIFNYSAESPNIYNQLSRAVYLFDTSSIPDNATIESAILYLTPLSELCGNKYAGAVGNYVNDKILLVSHNTIQQDMLRYQDYYYTKFGVLSLANEVAYNEGTFVLNSDGLALINKSGITKFGLRTKSDALNSPPTWVGGEYICAHYATRNHSNPAYYPKLTVTYSIPSPPIAPSNLTATCIDVNKPITSFTTDVNSGIAPLTVQFTDTSTGTPTSWLWEWGDGTANGTTQNPSHEFGVGVWQVKLTVTNDYGTSSFVKTITVIARDTFTTPDPIPDPPSDPQPVATIGVNSYILDKLNNKVLMYDADKVYLGYFGGTGSGDGQLQNSTWITKEGNNILVVDSGNNRIQVFNSSGVFQSKFGNANFKGIASNGVYRYATDYDNNKVIVFDMNGVKVTEFGSMGVSKGKFKQPYGIAVDNNYIYVVDAYKLQAFTLDYEFVAEAGRGDVNNPTDVWFDAINIYINNVGNDEVLTYSRAFNFPISVNVSKTLTLTNNIMGEW